MAREYQKTTWQDLPSQSTPLSATNLNHIEEGIYNLETKVENNASGISDLQSGKVDKVQGKGLSSNDFTGDDVTKLRYDTYTKQETRNLVDGSYTIAGKKANTTLGSYATAEGQDNTVTGDISHASGYNNTVSGQQSYAEGNSNTVSGNYSHVEGLGNIASGAIQHVSGQYNIADNNNTYAEIVGGGSDNNSRKNIRTLDWEGNARYSGDVYSKNKKIATEEFVEDSLNNFNAQPNVTSGTGIGNAAFVCYGGGKYVATGSNNSNGAWISSNGINWTHIDLPSATTQTLIKYVNGKYIIGLNNGKLIVSEDASNWSVIDTGLPNLKITGIIYDGTNYIVINYGGNVYSSADLTTWTSCGTPANYGLGIAYKTGKYVTIHGDSRTPIYYSTDLSEWHSAIRPSEMELGAIFTHIICGNGIFIVFGANEEIFYSTDGNIWNKIDYSFAYGGGYIDFSDSEFVMFKGNNNEFHIYYSDNGVLWTVWNETLTNRYNDIAVGISEFNIVGNGRASYFKFKKERYAELLAEKIGDNVEAINKGSVSKPVYFKDGVPKEANEMYSKTETDTLLASELATKVDKVQGKDLSTNDFTDADKIAVSSLGTASTKDVGTANGVAELDSNGKVPSSQLPSYVDDVIEGYYNSSTDRFYKESTFTTVIPLEDGKSWVDISTNKSYRWTGSVYVRVDEGVQLGETSSTAYRGDRGKTAYDHSQATGNPHGTTKSDVGLGNVDNTSDLDKPISTAVQTALNDKVDKVQGKGLSTNDYTTADKNKLAGIEAEANKTVVDSAMSDSSTNPLQNKVITKELQGTKTTSGNPITITDAAPVNAVNLSIDLEPIQAGSGTPSPDNIRPISGRSEVAINRVGKNVWDEEWEVGVFSTKTGLPSSNNDAIRTKNLINVKSNTSYYCNISTSNSAIWVFFYNDNALIEGYSTGKERYQNVCRIDNTIFTTPSNCNKIKFYVTGEGNSYANDISINYPSTDHDYHAYKGKTYTIDLGGTRYGGTLDVVSGLLTINKLGINVMSQEKRGWQVGSKSVCYRITLPQTATSCASNQTHGVISNMMTEQLAYYGVSRPNDLDSINFAIDTSGVALAVYDTDLTLSEQQMISKYTDLFVVYPLATPLTIQLTPQQIRLLKGTNNISCNTGDLSIKYYPDNVLGQLKEDIESEYDERVETLETQVQELQPSLIFMSRERRDITSDLSRLSIAVAEQNLEKYGYKIGDYFERVDGNRTYTYHIADYNTFKGTSTPYCLTTNHIGIVVDTHATTQWYSGDASAVGYNGSTLHTYLKGTVMDNIKADMIALFGGSTGLEHLLSHSKLLTTALANWGWQSNQYISALSEVQVFGSRVWGANGYQTGEAAKKLELFDRYKWTEIFGNEYPWLRDMYSASLACFACNFGRAYYYGVTNSYFAVGLINLY